MADKTTNYGLTKPNPEEFYDVNVQNGNMDIIDQQLKERTPCLAVYYPANTAKNADELIDPFAIIPVSLEINSELFNIIGGTFAWVWTNFYIEASVTSRRMQVAMTYNAINHKMAFRIYGANGWLPWKELATADLIPTTPSDIGAAKEVHEHTVDDISDFPTAMTPTSHTHTADDISGTLPISKGGTGATSAAAARSNIQAAKNVHKHNASDIDSGTLSSDRFPTIPITKGGTGAADSSKARENLGLKGEYWTFTLEDGQTVTKLVFVG